MNIKMCFAIALSSFAVCSLFAADPVLNYKAGKHKEFFSPEHPIYYIDFMPENFPLHTPLDLNIRNLNGNVISFKTVIDETNNLFVIEQKNKKELTFLLGKLMNGEPFECSLQSEDRKFFACATIMPNPIEAKDETGHTLCAHLTSKNLEIFSALAEGFVPFEEVECCSISCHEERWFKTWASPQGKIHMQLLPGVIGEIAGKASLEIKGKTTKNLKINYQWGFTPDKSI